MSSTQRNSQSIRFSYGKTQVADLQGKVYQIPQLTPSNSFSRNQNTNRSYQSNLVQDSQFRVQSPRAQVFANNSLYTNAPVNYQQVFNFTCQNNQNLKSQAPPSHSKQLPIAQKKDGVQPIYVEDNLPVVKESEFKGLCGFCGKGEVKYEA